jgi:hypothetical protein
MLTSWRNLGGLMAAGSLAASALILSAVPAAATIDKGTCTASATASQSGPIDLTSKATWTLVMADTVNGSWAGPTQTHVTIGATIFGLTIPVLNSTGKDTKGSAGPYNVADYAKYGRVIAVAGTSDDCHGYLTITISDANPYTNAISIVAIILIVVGLLILLALSRAAASPFKRFLGALAGALVGIGAGVLLIEIGTLDPQSYTGLVAPILGVVLGLFIPGTLHKAAPTPAV